MFLSENNPEFAALRAERQAQYGVTIAYIKERVGDGLEYANEIARAVLSPSGGYYELLEMPEEFAGALGGGVAHRLIAETEALEMLGRLESLCAQVAQGIVSMRALSLYVLYAGGSLKTRREMFVFDHAPGQALFAHGAFQPGIVPRFFKLRLEAGDDPSAVDALGLTRGVLFFLSPAHTDSGRHLLGTITRNPDTLDLGARPAPATMN